jgi:hypothetical protein
MKSFRRILQAVAVLASVSCYATHERGQAAVNARDWPTAEAELWRYLRGRVCTGRVPLVSCKQAAVQLGEVLIEDDRAPDAAMILRYAHVHFYKRRLGTPEVDKDLDDRIVNGLWKAKQRWDQFRAGVPGQCQLAARFRGAKNLQLVTRWTALDMERVEAASGPVDAPLLFDKVASAGPHLITILSTYQVPGTFSFQSSIDKSYSFSCENGERIEIVFQLDEREPSPLKIDVVASGGKPLPPEGPLRPNPAFPPP